MLARGLAGERREVKTPAQSALPDAAGAVYTLGPGE
jgi:hypothetical protein